MQTLVSLRAWDLWSVDIGGPSDDDDSSIE